MLNETQTFATVRLSLIGRLCYKIRQQRLVRGTRDYSLTNDDAHIKAFPGTLSTGGMIQLTAMESFFTGTSQQKVLIYAVAKKYDYLS